MLKKENLNIDDSSLELIGRSDQSTVFRMSDGRIVKILSILSLEFYRRLNIDLYKKLDASYVMEGIDGIYLPQSAITIKDTNICVGYTMEYNNGVSFNDFDLNDTLEDKANLSKYLDIHRKINELVKKCNEVGVIFPDLLTCDNIYIDKDKNISMIDIDGAQILNYNALAMSTALGDNYKYFKLKKYCPNNDGLLTSEIDKKSLMCLFFLDVLNCDLTKIGMLNPISGKIITLNEIFSMYSIDNCKIQRIISDNINDYSTGSYLSDFYNLIEKNYKMFAVSVDEYCKHLGIDVPEDKKNTYFKRFVKKIN